MCAGSTRSRLSMPRSGDFLFSNLLRRENEANDCAWLQTTSKACSKARRSKNVGFCKWGLSQSWLHLGGPPCPLLASLWSQHNTTTGKRLNQTLRLKEKAPVLDESYGRTWKRHPIFCRRDSYWEACPWCPTIMARLEKNINRALDKFIN